MVNVYYPVTELATLARAIDLDTPYRGYTDFRDQSILCNVRVIRAKRETS